MARTFTLGALVTRVRQRADIVNAASPSDTEIKENISSAIGELRSLLVGTGLRYFESIQSISAASMTDNGDGGKYIALPADYMHTCGVDYQEVGGRQYELEELMFQERNLFAGNAGGQPHGVAYAVVGANLVIYPSPSTGQTYRHIYVAQPTDYSASADGTSVDVVTQDGENFVVEYGVALALRKLGRNDEAAQAEAARDRARERVREDALRKALNNPRRLMVYDDGQGSLFPYNPWWARRV